MTSRSTILIWLGFAALAFASAACSRPTTPAGSEAKQFFENSNRRGPEATETDFMARLGGCAAFFVRNSENKNLVVTARHCVQHAITAWCNSGGTIKIHESGETRTCERVVAGDRDRDIAMIEVDGPTFPEERATRLAAFSPAPESRLYMVGYPGDSERRGRITTTSDCWVHRSDVPSPYRGRQGAERTLDRSYTHNCSTYGGNSGGPMLLEDTKVAVGLPYTYQPNRQDSPGFDPSSQIPNQRRIFGPDGEAHGAQMADFLEAHRQALDAEGVAIVENQNEVGGAGDESGGTSGEELDGDIGALLSQNNDFYFGTQPEAKSAYYCLGSETCDADDENAVELFAVTERENRTLFTGGLNRPDPGESFAVSAYAGDKKISERVLRLEAKRSL